MDERLRAVNEAWPDFTEIERNEMVNRIIWLAAIKNSQRHWQFVDSPNSNFDNPHILGA